MLDVSYIKYLPKSLLIFKILSLVTNFQKLQKRINDCNRWPSIILNSLKHPVVQRFSIH